jgi:hypothetical protein
VVYCICLESRRTERFRGFESYIFLHFLLKSFKKVFTIVLEYDIILIITGVLAESVLYDLYPCETREPNGGKQVGAEIKGYENKAHNS